LRRLGAVGHLSPRPAQGNSANPDDLFRQKFGETNINEIEGRWGATGAGSAAALSILKRRAVDRNALRRSLEDGLKSGQTMPQHGANNIAPRVEGD